VVIEKIVYVEKATAKKRPAHLRPVPAEEMMLPLFDAPTVVQVPEPMDEPDGVAVLDCAPAADSEDAASRLGDEERARLKELLDELTGLKVRLVAARGGRK
jgi:hypothetical protein